MAVIPSCDSVAVRHKAVLKHAQSKRWHEVRCGPANAKSSGLRAICGRCFPPASHPFHRHNPARGFVNFGFRDKSSGRKRKPGQGPTAEICAELKTGEAVL